MRRRRHSRSIPQAPPCGLCFLGKWLMSYDLKRNLDLKTTNRPSAETGNLGQTIRVARRPSEEIAAMPFVSKTAVSTVRILCCTLSGSYFHHAQDTDSIIGLQQLLGNLQPVQLLLRVALQLF